MNIIRITEGTQGVQGTVSGTDQTLMSLTNTNEHTAPNILRVWIENPTDPIVANALEGTNGITVISGSAIDIVSGFYNEFANASGTLSTYTDTSIATHTSDASAHHVRYASSENDALTGSDGITIVSGSNTVTVSGFRDEFVAASGSLQAKYDECVLVDGTRGFAGTVSGIDPVEPKDLATKDYIDEAVTLASGAVAFGGDDNSLYSDYENLRYDKYDGQFVVGSGFIMDDFTIFGNPITAGVGIVQSPLTPGQGLTIQAFTPNDLKVPTMIFARGLGSSESPSPITYVDRTLGGLTWEGYIGATHKGAQEFGVAAHIRCWTDDLSQTSSGVLGGRLGFAFPYIKQSTGIVNLWETLSLKIGQMDLDGVLTTQSGTFSHELTVSGVPVVTDHFIPAALIGSDGITVTSGSNTTTIAGFYTEFTNASGTLSSEIDSDITTHAAIEDAHHARYSKNENDALVGSDGITIVSGSNTIDIQGFQAEFINASGSLQGQIDNKLELSGLADNRVMRADGTTSIQDSSIELDDNGHLYPTADDAQDLGTTTSGWRKIFIPQPAAGQTARAGVRGFHSYATNADIFVGEDNVFPGYYCQRTTQTNSIVTNNSEDYTNLYQGDSAYPVLELNYWAGDGQQNPGLFDGVRNSVVSIGAYDNTNALGGGGLMLYGRGAQLFTYFVYDEDNARLVISGSTSTIPKKFISSTSVGIGGATVDFVPVLDNTVDLGLSTNRWKEGWFGSTVTTSGHTETAGRIVNITTVTAASITLGPDNLYVFADATSNSVTVNLPEAAGHRGREYIIKRVDTSGNNVTVDPYLSEEIDGLTTSGLAPYEVLDIVCNGTAWFRV